MAAGEDPRLAPPRLLTQAERAADVAYGRIASGDDPCRLLADETPDPGLGAAGLVALLEACVRTEQAVMAQYVYLLATLPRIDAATPLGPATALRDIARRLHALCVSEMAHMATACNLLVAFGGAPRFHNDALGRTGGAAGGRYDLAPLSASALARLIEFETRDDDARYPDPSPDHAVGLAARAPEKPGRVYRRVYYEVCRRADRGRALFVPPSTDWAPFYWSREPVDATPIRPGGELSTYTYAALLRAILMILLEGEGGPAAQSDVERPHVRELQAIAARLPALGALRVPALDNPSLGDAGLSPGARHWLTVAARLQEVILASLYVHWRADVPIRIRQQLHGHLAGLMSSAYTRVGAVLAATPAYVGADATLGPSFEVVEPVDVPSTTAAAWDAIAERADRLAALLAAPPYEPDPAAIGNRATAWLRRIVTEYLASLAKLRLR